MGFWTSWFGSLQSLFLKGLTLPQADLVCNLKVLPGSHSYSRSRGQLWLAEHLHNFKLYNSCSHYWIEEPCSQSLMPLWPPDWTITVCFTLNLQLFSIQNLQLLWNTAVWTVTGVNYSAHVTPLLCKLQWLPVCFWMILRCCHAPGFKILKFAPSEPVECHL